MSAKLDLSRTTATPAASKLPNKTYTLDIELPEGGHIVTLDIRRDLPVDFVKAQLSKLYPQYSVQHQELQLNGKAMVDPLSLIDFPSISAVGSASLKLVYHGAACEESKELDNSPLQADEDSDLDGQEL